MKKNNVLKDNHSAHRTRDVLLRFIIYDLIDIGNTEKVMDEKMFAIIEMNEQTVSQEILIHKCDH